MALTSEYLPGATPLDADELASLIPKHITTPQCQTSCALKN